MAATADLRAFVLDLLDHLEFLSWAGSEDSTYINNRDVADHLIDRHRLRNLVVLIAIRAGKITETRRNDLRHDRMLGRDESMPYQCQLARLAPSRLQGAFQGLLASDGHHFY